MTREAPAPSRRGRLALYQTFARKCLRTLQYGRERKNKFSKGCSSLGYNIVRASKRSRFQAPKSPIPWKIVRCTQQEAGPYDKNQGFV